MKLHVHLQTFALFAGIFLIAATSGWGQETIFHECVPTFTEIPIGWTSEQGSQSQTVYQSATGGYLLVNAIDAWVITKAYDLSGYTNVELVVDITSYGSGDHNPLTIEVSNDNGETWTEFFTTSITTTSYVTQGPFSISADGEEVKFKFWRDAASGRGVRFRNIKLTGTEITEDPTLLALPGTLTQLNYVDAGGPSSSQSFTVTGSNLDPSDATITIDAPLNFEVSLNNSDFDSEILVDAIDGSISETVYTRLIAGLSSGFYSGNINISGGEANPVEVSVSGSVPPGLPYTEDFEDFVSAETLPNGWTVSDVTYNGDWGSGFSAGLRGNDNVLGYQHTGTTGVFTASLTLVNNTGATIEDLFVSYLGKVARESQNRYPEWTVKINGEEVPGLFYSTLDAVDKHTNALITNLNIGVDEVFTLSWESERGDLVPGETSGASRQIGISNVSVKAAKPYYLLSAADDAANYTTGDFIAEGNKGYGFGDWGSASNDGGYSRGDAGEQGVNSAVINTEGNSFALWADDWVNVGREFEQRLPDNHTFSFNLAYQWDNGNRGFNLLDGEVQVFNWNVNDGGYTWEGEGSAPSTPWENDRENGVAMSFTFTQDGDDLNYSFYSPAGGGPAESGTIQNIQFDKIVFYVSGAGGGTGGNLYFNSLEIEVDDMDNIPDDATLTLKTDLEIDDLFEIENLIIEDGYSLTILPSGKLTVNGTLSNNNNGSKSEGGVFIYSDATGTGSLIHNNTDVNATVERYIARHGGNGQQGWHLLSAPVSGQDIVPEFFPDASSGPVYDAVDFYRWDESFNQEGSTGWWLNIKGENFGHTEFETGTGYLMAFGTPESTKDYGDKAHKFTGPVNVEDVNIINLSFTSAAGENAGWHLLGNPFASAVEWGGWSTTNIQGGPSVWSRNDGSYKPLTEENVIPAMNGFMIRVQNNETGALTIPANKRAHDPQGWYKKEGQNDRVVLVARDTDTGMGQYSLVMFRQSAETGIDPTDTYFKAGFAPSFYSIVEEEKLALNSLPEMYQGLTIPFGFEKNDAENFIIELVETIPGETLYLIDKKLDVYHHLTVDQHYAFSSEDGDDPMRFKLQFGQMDDPTGIDQVEDGPVHAWYHNNTLFVTNPEERAEVKVFDISGRQMYRFVAGAGEHQYQVNLPAGVYIVHTTTQNSSQSMRIVVSQ